MTGPMEDRPLCKCHGEPMHLDGHGGFSCAIARREVSKRWYWANREKSQEKARRWRAENPEKVREAHRRWVEENPERIREHRRRWRETNPDNRLIACGIYIGMCGFTQKEREEMLSGEAD